MDSQKNFNKYLQDKNQNRMSSVTSTTQNKNYTPAHVFFNSSSSADGPPHKKFKSCENNIPKSHLTVKTPQNIHEDIKKLPVYINRNEIIQHIRRHETLIIMSETGSGKTTQIPQLMYNAKLNYFGCIAITQPRRVAAISIALRVAQEMEGNSVSVGELVGYSVRFEEATSIKTKIKYLTDGMLLREAMFDKFLKGYNVVILDEAHERTIHTDVLFGIVKKAQKLRLDARMQPLKIIIMSATMDVDHFSEYFNNCKALYIEGRNYPVTIYHVKNIQDDYQIACIQTFFKIHKQAPPNHDILMFLTGQEEIESVAHQIRSLSRDPEVEGPPLKVFTLYATQLATQQMAVFQKLTDNMRKLVISTNIAETSVTIPGIKYVIDSGMVKVRSYHPSTGMEKLKVQRISQQQAWQRTGRAGRESAGACYRVYTKSQFDTMPESAVPEIQRCNLSTVCLQLLALGIHASTFDFMDSPPKEAVTAAFEQLKLLKAVEDIHSVSPTPLGTQMIKFPLDPRFTKVLLSAPQYDCLEEALTIVALLSVDTIFCNPVHKREDARDIWQRFSMTQGDHVALLNIFKQYEKVGRKKKKFWCHENFISMRNMLMAREIKTQLEDICKKCEMPIKSCGEDMNKIKKCLLHGLFMNVAQVQKDGSYLTLDRHQTVHIHPSSLVHGNRDKFVLFTEVVQTTKCYIKTVTSIKGCWLQDVASEYIIKKNIKLNLGPFDYDNFEEVIL